MFLRGVLGVSVLIPCLLSANDNIERISVFGNYNPVALNQMPSALFVLTKEQIDSVVGSSALDVLTQVPGINVQKSGVSQEIFLRGAETNFVIIQIDGVQVNNPLDTRGGSFDLGALSKDVIQRVEVIKGAQSSIYGSDAIAGVINFITYDSEFTTSSLSATLRSNGSQHLSGNLSFGSAMFGATIVNSDNATTGDEQKSIELTAHETLNLKNDSETQLSARYSDYQQKAIADQSGGILFNPNSIKDDKQGQVFSASIRHLETVSANYQLALQAEVFDSNESLSTPGIAPFFSAPPTTSENDYSYYKLRWLNGIQLDSLFLTAGLDYKSEQGETKGRMEMFTFSETGEIISFELPTNYNIERDNLAAFVDAKWQFNGVTVFAGARYDDTKRFDDQTTWKLGASYQLSEQIRLFANTGTAFKLPSLYALSNNLIGNPNLKPEQATNHDFGIEASFENSTVSLSVFNYDYTDLVDFDFTTFSLVNRSQITSSGAELIVTGELTDALSYHFDITYVELETSENEVLTGRPEWQGGAGLNYQYNDIISTSASFDYVGDTVGSSLHSGQGNIYDLDAYHRLDLTTRWLWQSNIQFDFYVQNIFDADYQVAVGVPSDDLGLGVRVHWIIE
ncbi:MAG: TonB-dependent receptor [Gammaproteobacteria bacterium]|nr:TonB-dependent receptor [Gammaproteobacteria bacterium]